MEECLTLVHYRKFQNEENFKKAFKSLVHQLKREPNDNEIKIIVLFYLAGKVGS
jgi:hypothetical protein